MKKTYRIQDVLKAISYVFCAIWYGIKKVCKKIKKGIDWYIINMCVIHPLIFAPGAMLKATVDALESGMTRTEAFETYFVLWGFIWFLYLGWLYRKHLISKMYEKEEKQTSEKCYVE